MKTSDTATAEQKNKWAAFIESEGFKFINKAEEKHDCASACKAGQWYLTRDVSDGKPESDCLTEVIEDIQGEFKVPGYVCVILGLFLLVAYAFTWPLCQAYNKNGMMNKDDA